MTTATIDDRISWCRLFAVGPACPFVCGGCKGMDAAATPEQRAAFVAERRRVIEQAGYEVEVRP